jgi:hypothetical protein
MSKLSRGLTAYEICGWLEKNTVTRDRFKGVYTADEIPLLSTEESFFIANTHTSSLPGEHWVAFYFPKRGSPEYFDTGGHPPEYYQTSFQDILILGGPKYMYNGMKIQADRSRTCGAFCIYYAYHRCRGLPMSSIVESFNFTNLSENDYTVLAFMMQTLGG